MTTVEDFEEYTGVFGHVVVDNDPWADVVFNVKWTRGVASKDRASKHSKVQVPGEFSVKCTITKALQHTEAAKAIGYSLNDTPITGTAGTLLATSHILDASDNYEDMTTPTITTLSRVKYTLQTKAITVAGTITIIGEDADGNAISEIIEVEAATPGAIWVSQKVYKKVYGHTIRAIDSTDDLGTFAVTSIVGNSSYSVGNPKIFDLVGSVVKGGDSITITMPDCWFSEGGLAFESATKILDCATAVEMHDPDLLTCDVVTA